MWSLRLRALSAPVGSRAGLLGGLRIARSRVVVATKESIQVVEILEVVKVVQVQTPLLLRL